jgi:hypothetical protein
MAVYQFAAGICEGCEYTKSTNSTEEEFATK